MANVTFTVSNDGLPIHKDATITIRPRLFLEGNFFLDLQPGSPSAADLSSGSTIPVTQTATAVQIDQMLTSLQKDTRSSLQRALAGYGKALNQKPTAAEDATQDPIVQGLTGGEAINKTFHYGGKAGRTNSIVNEALLGQHPHDLSNLVRGQRDVFKKLASTDGALPDLITNFNTTAGALAAESTNLSASIQQLAPTLEEAQPSLRHLNNALPPVPQARDRAGARRPPASRRRSRPARPWLVQTRKLLRQNELGGTASLLASAAPPLAKTTHATLKLFPQVSLTSRCVTHNLVPLGNEVINNAGGAYPFSTGQPVSREFLYGARQPRRREPGLRRQRLLRPLPGRRRPAARQHAEPQRRARSSANGPALRLRHLRAAGHSSASSPPRTASPSSPRSAWTSPATRRRSRTSTARPGRSVPPFRRRSREPRDPRAPPRLHRDRDPDRAGDRHHRGHPRAAVRELPVLDSDPRLRQLRAQGRVHNGTGGDPRTGPADHDRGDQGGDRGRASSSRTAPRS